MANVNNITTKVDAFEAYIHEDVEFCDSVDVSGGLQEAELYYCYLPFIESLRTPSAIGSNLFAGSVQQPIICRVNRGFQRIKALVDTSKLDALFNMNSGDSSQLDLFLLGARAELIGFIRKTKYRPFVYIVKDRNGRQFLFGNLVSPAYVKKFALSTGVQYEDDSGAEFQMESNSLIYEYQNEIPVYVPPVEGDFDDDWHDDFD